MDLHLGDVLKAGESIVFVESFCSKGSPVFMAASEEDTNKLNQSIREAMDVKINAALLFGIGFSEADEDHAFHLFLEQLCPESNTNTTTLAFYWCSRNGFALQTIKDYNLSEKDEIEITTVYMPQIKYVRNVQTIMRAFQVSSAHFDPHRYSDFISL